MSFTHSYHYHYHYHFYCFFFIGFQFTRQHGKLFVRPSQLQYLTNCHFSGGVHVYGNSTKDAVFFHYNNHWYGYSRPKLHLPGNPEPGYTIMR